MNNNPKKSSSSEAPLNPRSSTVSTPLTARLAHEVLKPNDWQAFQRNCTILFRAELRDPNAQEYGRGGQNQGGIDILGRRDGNPNHYVGVQCRLIKKPLKEPKILSDCRAALALKANLKEIIFATTAPHDRWAMDAAIEVERTLRAEGHDISVVVYGWEALQPLIACHDAAYHAFCPWVLATTAPQPSTAPQGASSAFASEIAAAVSDHLRQMGLAAPPREVGGQGWADEDPALHARIDTFRDLFKDQHQPLLAEKGLLELLKGESLDGKPWASFRIETNLGSIALDLGRNVEASERFQAAYAVRPDDARAIANLALARTIQGRFDEAMDLARRALSAQPRADHATLYLLQAAARSGWQGDPESLVPPDLIGTPHADLGIAEFLRQRNAPNWGERSLDLARKHPDVRDFKRVRAIAILSLAVESGAMVPGGKGPVRSEELNQAADDMKAIAEHYIDIGFADHNDLVAYLNNAAVLLRLAGRQEECEALLRAGLPKAPNDPQLRLVLALTQAALGRTAEALDTLAGQEEAENRLLAAELSAAERTQRLRLNGR